MDSEPGRGGSVAAEHPESNESGSCSSQSLHDGHETERNSHDLERNLSRVSSGPPYTVFSPGMKRWIIAMNCVSAFISPMTANIYFPALPQLAKDLHVSTEKILLTLTTYMIFQGLSPTIFGDFGDVAGRRPAFIVAFTIYLAANIGLALQRNYIALLLLRMLQSGGSSGSIALVYAVVADIAHSSERGKYMGIVGAGLTVGPAVGPVIGGVITQRLGWAWIFWFLFIVTLVWMVPYVLAVPETGRKVVGNGSVRPPVWNMTLVDYLRFRNQSRDRSAVGDNRRIPIPNPLNTLKILRHKDMAMVLFYNSTLYIGFMLATATLSSQFAEIYGYDELTLGLCYLPMGVSTTIGSICNGLMADWNFRRHAKKLGRNIDKKRGLDLKDFPIEKVRIQLAYPLVALGTVVFIGYAWALQQETTVAVPLVLTFFIGLTVTGAFQILNLLVVDLYAEAPATATAANNLTRCLAGAVATSVIDRIIAAWGRGWAFTFVALLFAIPSPCLWLIVRNGPRWREERLRKARERAEKGAAAAAASDDEKKPPAEEAIKKPPAEEAIVTEAPASSRGAAAAGDGEKKPPAEEAIVTEASASSRGAAAAGVGEKKPPAEEAIVTEALASSRGAENSVVADISKTEAMLAEPPPPSPTAGGKAPP
ncbi:chloramphenicol resistance protein [Xylariaceae sp. FL0804]|nr:chloramphenicol resistance protein [Xylariaceae sp. FL0804]